MSNVKRICGVDMAAMQAKGDFDNFSSQMARDYKYNTYKICEHNLFVSPLLKESRVYLACKSDTGWIRQFN